MTSTRYTIEEFGHEGKFVGPWGGWVGRSMRFPLTRMYRVEGNHSVTGASCSFAGVDTIKDARALIPLLQASDGDKYDTWDIIRYEPSMTVSIVEDLSEDDEWVEDHINQKESE